MRQKCEENVNAHPGVTHSIWGDSVCGGKVLGLSSNFPHPWGVEGRTGQPTPYCLSHSWLEAKQPLVLMEPGGGQNRCLQQGLVKVIICARWVRQSTWLTGSAVYSRSHSKLWAQHLQQSPPTHPQAWGGPDSLPSLPVCTFFVELLMSNLGISQAFKEGFPGLTL